jgi:hypothetical protein
MNFHLTSVFLVASSNRYKKTNKGARIRLGGEKCEPPNRKNRRELNGVALSGGHGDRCGERRGARGAYFNIGEHASKTIAAHGAVSAAQGDTV